MLIVDDLGVLDMHLVLSRANGDIVCDKKRSACKDIYI